MGENMEKIKQAEWIKASENLGDVCPVFKKEFFLENIESAILHITSLGVYEAVLNGVRVGDFIMAPGWTSYNYRLQVQSYDITDMLKEENEIRVLVGNGWAVGALTWVHKRHLWAEEPSLIACISIKYKDGTAAEIITDESWEYDNSNLRFSELYDGEVYDARMNPSNWKKACVAEHNKDNLIPHEGEIVREIDRLKPISLIISEKGEKIIDFGQNLTGYVQFKADGKFDDIFEISHSEILDKDGNFYTDNLRSALQKVRYRSDGKPFYYKPHLSFQGFRYIRLDRWPVGDIKLDDFTAITIHSDMKRTGHFKCSNEKINKLYENIIWGQKGNFVDIPTDCPQRDERLGWTGDAQVFVKAASYNYDVEKFFKKWLKDLAADQWENGSVPFVIPDVLSEAERASTAWGDAAVICPWQIYLTYGNSEILKDQFESMKKWIEYMRCHGDSEYLWQGDPQLGDWLGLDAPQGSLKGSTDNDLIATAFYAYSTSLFIKAGKAIKLDMTEYEELYANIVKAFRQYYIKDGDIEVKTQTAYSLILYFDLAEDKAVFAKKLADMVKNNGNKLTTGFVGTPYLLHALSQNGYADVAYSLLLQEEYPSWLYSVNKGATTIWEHWDGVMENGDFWSDDMNSYNHYAYGAVADWMYEVVCGINTDENNPGFSHIVFKPITDSRLSYAEASIETKFGVVSSKWERNEDKVIYKFDIPKGTTATVCLNNKAIKITESTVIEY